MIKQRKIYRLNPKRFVMVLIAATVLFTATYTIVDFFKFPERYVTTWKYQLYNDIQSGKTEAITYYNSTYTANGINLFE